MSIVGINGPFYPRHWQNPVNTSAASDATASVANTGSVTSGNMDAFFQSFSADLQSMLSQPNGATATQTAASQPLSPTHRHHHHHPQDPGIGRGSLQGTVNQLMTGIGQDLGTVSASAGGFANAGSAFAADVMQALKAYGGTS